MRRGGIEPPAPRRCWVATENFTTKPSTQLRTLGSGTPIKSHEDGRAQKASASDETNETFKLALRISRSRDPRILRSLCFDDLTGENSDKLPKQC
ncbi:hypothetical protein BDP55DRAFT_658892 [Colletotrichum godetiae]|uniref:Uncharacterized protein n=1 Tax=Colletotrichum godetiae TaxID=1209918 RepID=A0AAJ0EXF6_9PEZI|nr:uncharacterized protein BDP55DRAFT_658892 [Colletotrichum godetiae]KAK1687611.1 hypothetical protein BDP55DRAFT_658892 [Colletotrichum godetiae]